MLSGLSIAAYFGVALETELRSVLGIEPTDDAFWLFVSAIVAVVAGASIVPLRSLDVSWGRSILIGPLCQLITIAFFVAFASLFLGVLAATPTLIVVPAAAGALWIGARPRPVPVLATALAAVALGFAVEPTLEAARWGTWPTLAMLGLVPFVAWIALPVVAAIWPRPAPFVPRREITVAEALTRVVVGFGSAVIAGIGIGAVVAAEEDTDALARARAFDQHPLYWVGESFEGAQFEAVSTNGPIITFIYEPDLQIQTQRNRPLIGTGVPGARGARFLPRECLAIRGVPVAVYRGQVEMFTGDVTVVVFGGRERSLRALRALEAINARTSSRLPPPDPDRPLPPTCLTAP